jgi:hypothetical protein
MKYYEGEDGGTCELCYKMAHFESASGEILCQEHARKHPEYAAFKAERAKREAPPDDKPK